MKWSTHHAPFLEEMCNLANSEDPEGIFFWDFTVCQITYLNVKKWCEARSINPYFHTHMLDSSYGSDETARKRRLV